MFLAGVASLCWEIISIKMRWLGGGKIMKIMNEHQIQEFGFQPLVTGNDEQVLMEMTQ